MYKNHGYLKVKHGLISLKLSTEVENKFECLI